MTATRDVWVDTLLRIANPVFEALAEDRLRERMTVETSGVPEERRRCAHLEALGRSLAGAGPWLNRTQEDPAEEAKRVRLLGRVCEGLANATDPAAKDFMNFTEHQQPVVDAAFLAQGLLRSWDSVWPALDDRTRENVVNGLAATRRILPHRSNWLLFSGIVEAFLCKAGQDWDRMRVDYAIRQHELWYRGDGAYGDGPDFHWDYYNSYVIHPMLYDILTSCEEMSRTWAASVGPATERLRRYAVVQERFIGPDGSFPPIGRSLVYRFGAFHALAQAALEGLLPGTVPPASVRCALTAVIRRMTVGQDILDAGGWLRIGFCGHQPALGESYISTGSLYLCLCGMLPLGRPASDPFWADPDCDWTSKRIWDGEDITCDHALME